MKLLFFATLCFTLLVPRAAEAQIYADFEVSSDGSPLGTFRARLDYDNAPRTVANFVGLATGSRPWVDVTTNRIVRNQPYYDGRIFHRLIHNFMIQGGSSNGLGTAGSGYVIQDEFHPDLRHSGRYMLSMAKTNLPGSGNAQFFITLEAASHLDDKHSVFGEVISGREIIDSFADPTLHPTDSGNRPLSEITIDSVNISGPSLDTFDLHDPALRLPAFKGVKLVPSRNAAEDTFTVTFDRASRHDYLYAYSLDLSAWTPLSNILSLDSVAASPLTIEGLTLDRFFATLEAVDYSFMVNPSPISISNGSTIRFTTRAGDVFEITPNESGGGTWTFSDGSSGEISNVFITNLMKQSGVSISPSSEAVLVPLLRINFTLSSPSGPAARSSHQIILDFREPASGWSDGVAWNLHPDWDGTSFLHAFEILPPTSE